MAGRSWYRNATRNDRTGSNFTGAGTTVAYHAARADWIRSGRALCGVNISRPGYTISADLADYEAKLASPHYRYCRRCQRKAEQIDNFKNGRIA
jgi:hypothetical protein